MLSIKVVIPTNPKAKLMAMTLMDPTAVTVELVAEVETPVD